MDQLQGIARNLCNLGKGSDLKHGILDYAEDPSRLAFLVYEAASYAIKWLANSPRTAISESGLIYRLAKESGKAFMDSVEAGDKRALSLLDFERTELRPAKASLKNFNRRGGPRIDPTKPNHRAVAKLYRILDDYRQTWSNLLACTKESPLEIQARLHPLVKTIVNLEELSPKSWESWHTVGLQVKRELHLQIESSHLKRTWHLWGTLAPSVPLNTLINYG